MTEFHKMNADSTGLVGLCLSLCEHSSEPLVAVEGPSHVIRFANPAFALLFGRHAGDFVGRSFLEMVNGENRCRTLLDQVLQTGTPQRADDIELHAAQRYWSYSVWPIIETNAQPIGLMIQVTDATEAVTFRRQSAAMNEALMLANVRQDELIDTIAQGERQRRDLEAKMFQAQKLESLGVLAGGIAHDLNNILTPVVGYAEMARDCLPSDSPAVPILAEVESNARRAADLVMQILAYAGKGRFILEPVNLSRLVHEMKGLLNAVASAKSHIDYDLGPNLPPVEADATQIRQVVLNFVTNACEAMADAHGTITVRTRVLTQSQTGVVLEVIDTGPGISADILDKIFDPFFTTKFNGRGLGLAAVQGIARGHDGSIEVESIPGQGSTFRLLLPTMNPVVQSAAEPVQPPTARKETGTILVIDDERHVRDMTCHILKHAGFTVIAADSGPEGVTSIRGHAEKIDAAVIDMTMPKMDGLETSKAIRAVQPGLPIILMSGYSVTELTRQSLGFEITAFVQKPFTLSQLMTAVRQIIANGRAF
ncbi:hypothetical protein BH11PLA2_BH11PLA2_19040 [soil metagenome]